MSRKDAKNLYQKLSSHIKAKTLKSILEEKICLHETVRSLRRAKGLSGAELCRRAKNLDPRTLTAVEKGRIRNPSIQTLQSLARGLGISVSDLFRQSELAMERYFQHGSQKGTFQMEFPSLGVKIVSFTPFIENFFCGKLILASKKRLEESLLKHNLPLFVWTLVGRFEVDIEGKKFNLKEGDNLFFHGRWKYSFTNPLHRESVLLMVTAPSFL